MLTEEEIKNLTKVEGAEKMRSNAESDVEVGAKHK